MCRQPWSDPITSRISAHTRQLASELSLPTVNMCTIARVLLLSLTRGECRDLVKKSTKVLSQDCQSYVITIEAIHKCKEWDKLQCKPLNNFFTRLAWIQNDSLFSTCNNCHSNVSQFLLFSNPQNQCCQEETKIALNCELQVFWLGETAWLQSALYWSSGTAATPAVKSTHLPKPKPERRNPALPGRIGKRNPAISPGRIGTLHCGTRTYNIN